MNTIIRTFVVALVLVGITATVCASPTDRNNSANGNYFQLAGTPEPGCTPEGVCPGQIPPQ